MMILGKLGFRWQLKSAEARQLLHDRSTPSNSVQKLVALSLSTVASFSCDICVRGLTRRRPLAPSATSGNLQVRLSETPLIDGVINRPARGCLLAQKGRPAPPPRQEELEAGT